MREPYHSAAPGLDATMADEPSKNGSWWTTVPGLLTAAAAVITAASGLVAVLAQNGIIGRNERAAIDATGRAGVAAKGPGAATPEKQTPAGPAPERQMTLAAAATLRPGPYRTVRVTRRDGTTIDLRDDFMVSIAKKFELGGGQSIDFTRIARIDVVEVDDLVHPATARVTLNDGKQITGKFDPYWDLKGRNDLGEFYARWPEVRSVEFVR